MQPIHIFRPGKHTPMDGDAAEFSEADLTAAAAAYDPALHEAPIVIGHPAHDAPAYGWVEKLEAASGALSAHPRQVDPAFAEIVSAGRYKKVSASFYRPAAAANPKPGVYYLRHIGFLGAQPPAIKGLKAVEFADDAADLATIEFGEFTERGFARLFRRLRDYIVEQAGPDKAEKILPAAELDFLQEDAARPDVPTATPAQFAETTKPQEVSLAPPKTETDMTDKAADDLAIKQAELDKKEKELTAQAAQFAERERKSRRADNERLLDDLEKAGKFAPGMRPAVLDFMDGLDAADTVEFGEGDTAAKETALGFFRGLLAKSGQVIDFSERSKEDGATKISDSAEDIAAAALEFQESEGKAGRRIHIADAVVRVAKKRSA